MAVRPTCGYENLGVPWTQMLSHSVPVGPVGFIIRGGFGPGRQQSSSRLLSPTIPRDSPQCIKFYYYVRTMPSNRNFMLVEVDSDGGRRTLWTAHTLDQKDQWLSTDIIFPRSNRQTQIEFRVTQSAWASVSVDLDEISVESNVPCVNECANTPCQNEGTCFNRINGYYCVCQRGFRRLDCSEEIVCQARVAPSHGTMSITTRVRLDTFVVFRCNQGYYMRGEAWTQCLGENRWDHAVPTCNIKRCANRNVPNASKAPNKNNWVYGESVTYTCREGYRMVGRAMSTCQSNNQPTSPSGTWSSNPPSCTRIRCPNRNVDSATKAPNRNIWYYGQSVTYTCTEGYRMVGVATSTCQSNDQERGTWSSDQPNCIRKTCNSLVIADGTVSPRRETYNYGSSISFTCNHGYGISHSRRLRCVDTNRWSPDPPTCSRITCPLPHIVSHATSTPEKQTWYYRDTVTYNCIAGYVIMGRMTSQCSIAGTWGQRPECNLTPCDLYWPHVTPNSPI
ncbi:E-selectin-like [Ciona intestinalis]